VLVIGFEKMTELATAQVGEVLLKACYAKEEAGIPGSFAGVFGKIAQSYFDRFGDQSDALAMIAAKNHKNWHGQSLCPHAQGFRFRFLPHGLRQEPVRGRSAQAHRLLAHFRRRAALVISAADVAKSMPRAVQFRAAVHVNDFLPLSRRDRPASRPPSWPGRRRWARPA
jgi:acetyl-CoA C-acetyltransferase